MLPTGLLNITLIFLLSILLMSCGILDGDKKKDEPPTENELQMLINGKPWQEYHTQDRISKSYPSAVIGYFGGSNQQNSLHLLVSWSIEYQSLFSEHFMIKFVFPEDYNLSELVIPYSQSFSDNTLSNTMYFNEWIDDGLISIFERPDKLHEPRATITYLNLGKGIIEAEFEGSIIVPVDYNLPQYSRWYGTDTLRITEGRISSMELKDLREQ